MGQREVYQYLTQHPEEWISTIDIANAINADKNRVSISCRKLLKIKGFSRMKDPNSRRHLFKYSTKSNVVYPDNF